ncbi:MAG: exonuclease SbcCD subunit D C-terminal domain-containing protein [Desulfovibrio sp.]|nr:exonuclease SbcCD subunit D C-terminal domain-containing protein [Desulfovibrio sp.]
MSQTTLRVLHTSDWHLGCTLYGRKRYEEFAAFLDWLALLMEEQRVDLLLIAGDIFDTTTPSNRAQELYYAFLCRMAGQHKQVIITAGNHDSPSFLAAPKALLSVLKIHVIGQASDDPWDEIVVVRDKQGLPAALVLAVPYLRDRDLRLAEVGESFEQKDARMRQGLFEHYARVRAKALSKQAELGGKIPLLAMGHLFTSGGQTTDGDGVRELYVGKLAQVSAEIFGQMDYVALGHLHLPQMVQQIPTIRYSGSPLPMGFGEAGRQKSLMLLEFTGSTLRLEPIAIPCWQELVPLAGNLEQITQAIRGLVARGSKAWLEITYTGQELISDLHDKILAQLKGTEIEVLRIKNERILQRYLQAVQPGERLENLTVEEVFARCLKEHEIPKEQQKLLTEAFWEIRRELDEEDSRAV